MKDNLFEHYVIGGGWAMLILVPASVAAVATILRAVAMLYGRPVQRVAAEVYAAVTAQRVKGGLSLSDARTLAGEASLRMFAVLQPLSIIYGLAPVVGALGSVWALGKVWRGPVSLQGKNLALALEHAFVPLGWGLWIALVCVLGFGLLRARLGKVEREVLVPAAFAACNDGNERRAGERKL